MMTGSEQIEHDPATCPDCLHAAEQDDETTGGAAAWAVASTGVGLLFGAALALWLLAG